MLGHVFLVWAFQQSIQVTTRLFFHQLNEIFDPHKGVSFHRYRHVGALVMRTVIGNFFGAGTQAGNGHHHLAHEGMLAILELPDQCHLVIHNASHAGDRC